MGGPSGPPQPTRQEQLSSKRSDLETRITTADNITEQTREEFRQRFASLSDPSGIIGGRVGAAQTRRQELQRAARGRVLTAQEQRELKDLELLSNQRDLTESEFGTLDEELGAIENELDQAIRGEGIFGRRQRRQSLIERTRDRPGSQQTRGAFLTSTRQEREGLLV